MSTQNLTVYVNDHLAGSEVALGVLLRLPEGLPGNEAAFYRDLHAEITADQAVLKDLLGRIGAEESGLRRTAGWAAEKAGSLKLKFDGLEKNDLGRFEALEILTLGIQGKRIFWRTLAALGRPEWKDIDFTTLETGARDQRDRVEIRRLEAARRALGAADA